MITITGDMAAIIVATIYVVMLTMFFVSVAALSQRHPPQSSLREAHHAYLGLVLVFAAPLCGAAATAVSIAGMVLVGDDGLQHFTQIYVPAFRSPINRAYQWAVVMIGAHVPWVLALARWADRLGR